MKKYIYVFLLLACYLSSSAQHSLIYGQPFFKTPLSTPAIHFDLLRNQQPYIQEQNRRKWAEPNDWLNISKYISQKNSLGYFTLLEDHSWMFSAWDRNNSYNYNVSMDAMGKRVEQMEMQVQTLSKSYDAIADYEYNASGDLSDIIFSKAPKGSSDFKVEKVQYFVYDTLHRLVCDSLIYMIPAGEDPIITTYTYVGDSIVEALLYIQGDHGKRDTVRTMRVMLDDQGRMEQYDQINYYNNTPQYEFSGKEIFLYDVDGKVERYERYEFNSSGFLLIPVTKIEHTYESNGKLKGWTQSNGTANGKWMVDNQLVIHYDANGEADTGNVNFFNQDIFIPLYEQRFLFLEPATSGVRNVAVAELQLYPNPASNYIHIPGTAVHEEITILDVNGKTCWRDTKVSPGDLDISALKPGVYWVHITGYKPTKLIRL